MLNEKIAGHSTRIMKVLALSSPKMSGFIVFGDNNDELWGFEVGRVGTFRLPCIPHPEGYLGRLFERNPKTEYTIPCEIPPSIT
jgi:hypothetical protein